MVEYDDLAELQARELPSLKIADSSKFSQGLIPAVPKVRKIINFGKTQKHPPETTAPCLVKPRLVEACKSELEVNAIRESIWNNR